MGMPPELQFIIAKIWWRQDQSPRSRRESILEKLAQDLNNTDLLRLLEDPFVKTRDALRASLTFQEPIMDVTDACLSHNLYLGPYCIQHACLLLLSPPDDWSNEYAQDRVGVWFYGISHLETFDFLEFDDSLLQYN